MSSVWLFVLLVLADGAEPGELRRQASAALDREQYAECAKLYGQAATLSARNAAADDAYNAACCASLARDLEGAYQHLERAVGHGFRDLAHLEKDVDLAALRGDRRWRKLSAAVKAQERAYLRSINQDLYRLYKEDQAARSIDGPPPSRTELIEGDTRRRKQVARILEAGRAKTSDDYYHAAMVFQHGDTAEDYRRAHELAVRAAEIDPGNGRARWLAAAAKDRELVHLGKPQLYGTQYRQQNGRTVLIPVDPTVTDEERKRWNVPPLAEAKRRLEALNRPKP